MKGKMSVSCGQRETHTHSEYLRNCADMSVLIDFGLHLHRPVSVRLSDAQVDEAGHRQTNVEPVTEAEVVDELEHVLHTQEDQAH